MKPFRIIVFLCAAISAIGQIFTPVLVDGTGLLNPTTMTMLADGRILIGQQSGTVKVVKKGVLLPGNALSITVDGPGGAYTERGLLGITTDPNFANNGFVYIFYTTTVGGSHNKVSRFKMTGDVMDPSSETLVVDLDPVTQVFHNGGALHFDLAGKLLIGTGENTVRANSQSLTTTHGKILRLNSDGTIPPDNPFANDANATTRKIYKYGLRNPFTMDVQPGTGRFYINDVGQDAWEEIDDATLSSSRNFGWPNAEGYSTDPAYINPIYTYSHGTGPTNGCAISGGSFFNPPTTNYPSKYLGKYFFLDLCSKWLYALDPTALGNPPELVIPQLTGSGQPVGLDVAADGNLYYLMRGPDALYKITYSGSVMPIIVQNPMPQTVAVGQPVTFYVSASGQQPLLYQWQKNNTNIPNATNAQYTLAAVAAGDAGSYRVVVSNSFGQAASASAGLTVSAFNTPPVVVFTVAPPNNSLFVGGQVFNFFANATDAQDGTLAASQFTWQLVLHHNTHVHDGIPVGGSKSFSITIPTQGETDTNIFWRILVWVTDAGGLKDTAFIDLKPTLKNILLNTSPPGLSVKLDGIPVVTPVTAASVVGVQRLLEPLTPQTFAGTTYAFVNWSNGQAASQVYATANKDSAFTAQYQASVPTVSITSPVANTSFMAPGSIVINATATDLVSTIAKVDFYSGATYLGTDATAPYSFTWNGVGAGSYSLSAKSTNNFGVVTSSASVPVTVAVQAPPVVSLTAPANNALFTAPATVNLAATATQSNGTIAKVEFYNGVTLLGTSFTAPYSFGWTNVAAGTYSLTAKAYDKSNASTTSAPIGIRVATGTGTCQVVDLTSTAWVFRNDWSDQANGSSLSNELGSLKVTHRPWGQGAFWLVSTATYPFAAGTKYTIAYDAKGSFGITSTEMGLATTYGAAGPNLAQPSVLAPMGYPLNAYTNKSGSLVPATTGSYNLAIKFTLNAQPNVGSTYNLQNLSVCKGTVASAK